MQWCTAQDVTAAEGQELEACLGDKAIVAKAGQEVICPPSDLKEDLLIHPSPTPRPAGDAPSHLKECSRYGECELQVVCKAMTESQYIPSIFTADQSIHPNPTPNLLVLPQAIEGRSSYGECEPQIVCAAMPDSHGSSGQNAYEAASIDSHALLRHKNCHRQACTETAWTNFTVIGRGLSLLVPR